MRRRHWPRPAAVDGRRSACRSWRTTRMPDEESAIEIENHARACHNIGSRIDRGDFTGGGVSCDATTTSTASLPFEASSKRRKGISLRDPRASRLSSGSWEQGTVRETWPQRSLSVWLPPPLSRNAACVRADSTVASATTTSASRRSSRSVRASRNARTHSLATEKT